jgi:hypothetical protein
MKGWPGRSSSNLRRPSSKRRGQRSVRCGMERETGLEPATFCSGGSQPMGRISLPAGTDREIAQKAYFVRLLTGINVRETIPSGEPIARMVFGLVHTFSNVPPPRANARRPARHPRPRDRWSSPAWLPMRSRDNVRCRRAPQQPPAPSRRVSPSLGRPVRGCRPDRERQSRGRPSPDPSAPGRHPRRSPPRARTSARGPRS